MSVHLSPWLVWLAAALAVCGLWAVCWAGFAGAGQAVRWLQAWIEAGDASDQWWYESPECHVGSHGRCQSAECACECHSGLDELPAERSWSELTEPLDPAEDQQTVAWPHGRRELAALVADYERHEPAWRAECRLAYSALGIDDPTIWGRL